MKRLFLLFSIVLVPFLSTTAQNTGTHPGGDSYETVAYKYYGIGCSTPEGFTATDGEGTWWEPREGAGRPFGRWLDSQDGKCRIYLPKLRPLSSPVISDSDAYLMAKFDLVLSLGLVRTGKSQDIRVEDYVTKITGFYPEGCFGADTVYIYRLPEAENLALAGKDANGNESLVPIKDYPRHLIAILCKNGRQPFPLLILTKPDDDRDEMFYFRKLEHSLKFLP